MNLSKEKFEKFLNKVEEPDFVIQHRKNSFNEISNSEMISFRHGLKILIKPENFIFEDIEPKHHAKNNSKLIETQSPNVKVYSSHQLKKNEMDSDIFNSLPDFFSEKWMNLEDKNKLYYFNQAFMNDFLIIKIPENFSSDKPIRINLSVNEKTTISGIFILAEKNSNAKILFSKLGNKGYFSEDIRILTKENSKIDFISFQDFGKEVVNMQKRKAICLNNSEVKWVDICLGSMYTKSSVTTSLEGEGANTNNLVLYIASGNQKYDIYTASIHVAPHTTSDIVTKGVVNDEAKALSRGLVKIEENAFGSDGYETQDALLLSESAEADAIPNLEINNHDVKCSHGSTVSQIDEDKIFYLMSRGLSKKQSQQKIVEGYFNPVIELFEDEELKENINKSIMLSLS